MASYQQLNYCKKCKKNVALNEKGQCAICSSTQIKKSWTVRFRYITEDGKEIQKRLTGFENKKDAKDAEFKFKLEHTQQHKKIKNLTFKELYEEYKTYLESRTKSSTVYDFISKTKSHIYSYFKNYDVIKITPKILLEWQNSISKFSFNYKSHLRTCLSGMLKYAEKYYDIPNQLRKVDNFRNLQPKEEMKIWTPEQFALAMTKVKKYEYRVFYTALYYTGARKGEMMATYWSDWDFQNKILNINKSISNKVSGASWMVTTPKNNSSVRKIKLSDNLIDIMKKFYEYQKEQGQISTFTFGGEAPLPETCISRYLTAAAKEADLPIIRVHDLRHSHASFLLSKGVSIVSIAKRLGHNNIEQTLNTYSHMMPDDEEILVRKLQEI